VRPKQPVYNFKPLEDVIKAWKAKSNEQAWTIR
jgi:hypothetical protein